MNAVAGNSPQGADRASDPARGGRVMVVTGEASGDLHGAGLIKAVRQKRPDLAFMGVGGPRMEAAGCEILIPGRELSVMGLVEVIGHFPVIWRAFQRLKKILHGPEKPVALVLIDFPDFNLRLARQAKLAGIPVLYYVSPQVWAWRRGRVKKIAAVVDSLAAILPFEPDFYRGYDIHVEYVGNPVVDDFSPPGERDVFLESLGIPPGRTIVGLFPGSRYSELKTMLATLAETARLLVQRIPDVHFLVPVADTLDDADLLAGLGNDLPLSLTRANIYAVAGACQAVLTVSGTVTLQIAMAGTPMAIFYKAAPLTYQIGRRLVRVEHFGLVNIVAGRRVAAEYLQDAASPEALAAEVVRMIRDADYRQALCAGLAEARRHLGDPGCSQRVAGMLCALLPEPCTMQSDA